MDFGRFSPPSSSDSYFPASGSRSLDFDVREIKQLLLSGDNEEIAVAATRVLSSMKDPDSVVRMITSDISELLCDAMPPFDSFLTSVIYKCLEIMARCKYFFVHNHSSSAMDAVVRSLHFLVKSNNHDSSVDQSVSMLRLIVSGCADHDVLPAKKSLENLASLLLILLTRERVSNEIILHTGYIIKGLFDAKFWAVHYVRDFRETVVEWFDRVCAKPQGTLTEEIVHLGCVLCAENFRYATQMEDFSRDSKTDSNARESKLIDNVVHFLTVLAVPHIKDSPLTDDENEVDKLENYFASLRHMFTELFPQRFRIAQTLSELGFIQFLAKILSRVDCGRNENLGNVCVSLLFEMIKSLSDEVFHFPEMWPSGRDHFLKEITTGMSFLPRDASQWTDMMTHPDVNRSSRLALVVYFYFHLLTVKSPLGTASIYPSAARLLNSSIGVGSSPLMIKTMWFIYVMSRMSESCVRSVRGDREWSSGKLLEILESRKNLSDIYTHHPALLYWAFSSSEISCRIQCEVMRLWLENRHPNCCVLDELVAESADARSAIFEILQSGCERIAHAAFSTLRTFMLKSEDENLSCNIWFLLPQTLAKYVADKSTVFNADYVVELATLRIPQELDAGKVARVASLLPEALDKSDLISLSPALKLSLQLLKMSVEYEDSRVLTPFLRFEGFARKLISGIESDDGETVATALEIFGILWKRKPPAASHRRKPLVLNASVIVKILDGCDVELVNAGLVLLEQMLATEFKSDIVVVDGMSPNFLDLIFFDVENILVRYVPSVTGHAWKCLKHCLLMSDRRGEDVLLLEVVKCGLPHLNAFPEMTELLTIWIRRRVANAAVTRGGSRFRGIGGSTYFLETIRDVCEHLARNPCDQFRDLSRSVLECCERFSVDTSVEPFASIRRRTGG